MRTLRRPSWLPYLVASSIVVAAFAAAPLACSGDETSGTAASTGAGGTGGPTTSATGGMTGTGGTGTGGTSTSTATGGSGTGGTGTGGTGGTGTGGGSSAGYDCSPPVGTVPALKVTQLATGLSRPVLIKGAPGDNDRLYILEQTGQIRILKNGTVLPTPFLDLSGIVHVPTGGDERGLLGLAFHPNYAQNGRFFVYYTRETGSPGDQVIAEYARSGTDVEVANPMAVDTLMTLPDTQGNHNGGTMEFSPIDGYLYIGTGDGGGANDDHGAFGNALNLSSVWGKIFRIDVSTTPYSIPNGNMTMIPPGNPTTGTIRPEIWDFGLRNPWRMSFDACTGDLYIGDVGQDQYEEIDVEPAGQGQKNYGWKVLEANYCFTPALDCNQPGLTPPVDFYDHGMGCSINGGYVYRGSAIPALRGAYFYGDYCTGLIQMFSWANGMKSATVNVTMDLDSFDMQISSFGQDNAGEVYVVALSGSIYRIDAE
jgi:glucose/arabinose dehydrogenase